MIQVYEEKQFDNFDELYDSTWSGATDTMDEIRELHNDDAEEDFFNYVMEWAQLTAEMDVLNTTQLNDFIWFDCDDFVKELKNTYEEEEEDE